MEYSNFVDSSYSPGSGDLVCLYRVEPARGITLQEAAGRIAAECSIGMPNGRLENDRPDIFSRIRRLAGTAFEVRRGFVKVAYPEEMFEPGNMQQILSCIAGGVFGINAAVELRLQDVMWPKKIVGSFKGPQFGVEGVRKMIDVQDRPLISTIPYPRVGMNSENYSKLAYLSWLGGVDFLREDSHIASQDRKRFKDRVSAILRARDRVEQSLGERRSYVPNITAETREMVDRARIVRDSGNEYVMVDTASIGWSALQTLRDECDDLGLAIYSHHLAHPSVTRNPSSGVSMLVLADIARMVGVDQLYLGSVFKDDRSPASEFLMDAEAAKKFTLLGGARMRDGMHGARDVMPAVPVTGNPASIPEIVKLFGKDVLIQFGDIVHNHPDGTRDGATAVRQAVDAATKGVPIKSYARNHIELWESMREWGSRR